MWLNIIGHPESLSSPTGEVVGHTSVVELEACWWIGGHREIINVYPRRAAASVQLRLYKVEQDVV